MSDLNDQNLSSAEHDEILSRMQEIQTALDLHISLGRHAQYVARTEIEQMVGDLTTEAVITKRTVEAIVTTIKGPVDEITGEHRDEMGMEGKISKLYAMTQNGGVPARVVTQSPQSKTDRTAIWTAAVTGVLTAISLIVVAYLQFVAP